MPNAMPTEDCELLLSTDAPHVPEIPGVGANRRKIRFVLPLVGAIVAVGAIGIWTLGSHGHHLKAMSTAATVQKYGGTSAYGYKNVGAGACLLPNGDAIKGMYFGIKEDRAQKSCDADPDCKGYVASSGCRGAFLYDNPDGTVKGGGDQPKDSHTWRDQPCMAKNFDVEYTKLGYGLCIRADGEKVNKKEFLPDVQDNGVTCRRRCGEDPECLGFSAATVNYKGCYLWKEGDLKAGGRDQRWNVASCYVKESAGNPDDEKPAPAPPPAPAPAPAPSDSEPAPTGDDVEYTNLGSNKCTNADRTALKHKWFGKGSSRDLEKKCNADPECYGYSASAWGGGLLWQEGGLQKGGAPWGHCKCMVKA